VIKGKEELDVVEIYILTPRPEFEIAEFIKAW
jgi:hypothetical protein